MHTTLSQVAEAVDGLLVGPDAPISGVSIDSRSIAPGQLFVPIVAERDGHDFIAAAVDAGATGFLRSREIVRTDAAALGVGAVAVTDTNVALQRLATSLRDRIDGPVVGITGSVGKTSTKDLLASVLQTRFRTQASYRSFNNELGVPLTLCNAPDDVEAVVVEMGARGRGHIRQLCEIARPTIGVVTAVGEAHTALFGTVHDVSEAKGELVEALPSTGTAVLRADAPLVVAMADRTNARVLTFGPGGDVFASDIHGDRDLRHRFTLHLPSGSAPVRLGVSGGHMVDNALAAAAVAFTIGMNAAEIAEALATSALSPWRMEVGRTPAGALIINDSYNANPLSMHAAIDALLESEATRRFAVLGEMAELGDNAEALHAEAARRLHDADVVVVSVATSAYGGRSAADVHEAAEMLGPLHDDDVVLIKASRVAGLERLATILGAAVS